MTGVQTYNNVTVKYMSHYAMEIPQLVFLSIWTLAQSAGTAEYTNCISTEE